jgi:hypothetical protein
MFAALSETARTILPSIVQSLAIVNNSFAKLSLIWLLSNMLQVSSTDCILKFSSKKCTVTDIKLSLLVDVQQSSLLLNNHAKFC